MRFVLIPNSLQRGSSHFWIFFILICLLVLHNNGFFTSKGQVLENIHRDTQAGNPSQDQVEQGSNTNLDNQDLPSKEDIESCEANVIKQKISPEDFVRFLQEANAPCSVWRIAGGRRAASTFDGDKLICLEDKYRWNKSDCTVLSFGIKADWSFDDWMSGFGCKVYSFDPTIHLKDHNRSASISFYNLGISNAESIYPIKVDRYENILERIGVKDKQIDYLKMDVEGYEYRFFDDVFQNSSNLLQKINQIGMEIHIGKVSELVLETRQRRIYKHLKSLECHGFKRIHIQMNEMKKYQWRDLNLSSCYEVVYAKPPIAQLL